MAEPVTGAGGGIIGSGLGTLGTLGSQYTEEGTGIPYKTEYYNVGLNDKSGGGYFYGTGYNPSQRFIYQRLRTDSGGDPIKMFEAWENFSDEDKAWIAEADQRRDQLTPEEISTIDILKQVGGETIKPFLQAGAEAALYASGNTIGSLGFDPLGADARLTQAAQAEMGGDSVGLYSVKKATPFYKTDMEKAQAIANKAPQGYEYSPELNKAGAVDFDSNTMLKTKDGIYHKSGTNPQYMSGKATQGTYQKPVGSQSIYNSSVKPAFKPTYGGTPPSYLSSAATSNAVSAGAPSVGSYGYGQTMGGSVAPITSSVTDSIAGDPSFWSKDAFGARADSAFAPTAMASSFAVSFGVNLITGSGKPMERIEEAADSAFGATVGSALGTLVGGPVGGFIGSTIGSMVASGGRVICNELMNQKLLTRQDVILDYKFTRDYLTPTHVKGYHVWAISVVKQMRKGRFVKLFRHLAQHRANEIAYIYGKRDKPDYLGKLYRRIGEPTCWVIGVFCEQSDWSILYKEKKIGN